MRSYLPQQIHSILKNSILIVIFGVLLATTASAQISFKAGVNIATIAEEGKDVTRKDIDNKSVLGAILGITAEIPVADVFYIQPELLFSQSGGSNSYTVGTAYTKSTYKINYLELPVLAKLKFGNKDESGVGIHVAAGPWLGYALKGHSSTKTTVGEMVIFEQDRDYSFDDQDNAERVNYGLIAAAGLSFGHMVLDLRYNFGLNNLLDKDANNGNDSKPVLQTRGVALTVGYRF